jgi:hypothetical protein
VRATRCLPLLRRQLIGRRAELDGVRLTRSDAAVEVDAVDARARVAGRHVDRRLDTVPILERRRCAVARDDAVAVVVAGCVVAPVEGLQRLVERAVGDGWIGSGDDRLERLEPREPPALVLGVVGAMNRKAETPLPGIRVEVEPEEDRVVARDRLDRDAARGHPPAHLALSVRASPARRETVAPKPSARDVRSARRRTPRNRSRASRSPAAARPT